jgi:hypothetical protein
MIPAHEISEVSKAKREDWANPEDQEEIEFWDTTEKRKKRIAKFLFSHTHLPREIKITTIPDGYNSGRIYILQTSTEEECDEWIHQLTEVVENANLRWQKKNRVKRFQSGLSAWFKSMRVQSFISLMIAGNFVQEVIRLQLRPDLEDGTYGYRPDMVRKLELSDLFFTLFFLGELCINLTAHW